MSAPAVSSAGGEDDRAGAAAGEVAAHVDVGDGVAEGGGEARERAGCGAGEVAPARAMVSTAPRKPTREAAGASSGRG